MSEYAYKKFEAQTPIPSATKGAHQERISEPVHKTHNKEQPIKIFQSTFVYTTTTNHEYFDWLFFVMCFVHRLTYPGLVGPF